MIRVYEIIRGIKQPLITFYDLDDSQISSDDCVTEGFFITSSELEQRERAAFYAGRNGTSYNDDISGQIVDLWKYNTADDYLKQRKNEAK